MKIKNLKLKIKGIHCISCTMNIDGELEDTEGVKSSNTNYAKQQTEIEFDESKISEKRIAQIINKLGYNVFM